jgi:hypothetical protein
MRIEDDGARLGQYENNEPASNANVDSSIPAICESGKFRRSI